MKNLLLRVSCTISGFPLQLITQSDFGSKIKVHTFAIGILLVMFLNSVSTYFFCSEVLQIVELGIIVGIFIVCIVTFLIERIIIHSDRNPFSFAFRLIISLVSAIIFSTGIDLSLFRNDIEKQVTENRVIESKNTEKNVDTLYFEKQKLILTDLERTQKEYFVNDSLAKAELDHKFRPGDGRIYKEKRNEADRAKTRIDSLSKVLVVLRDSIRLEKEQKVKDFLSKPIGLLEKIHALHIILSKGSWETFLYFCLFILFVCLDLTVLITKTFGKKTVFEYEQDVLKQLRINEANQQLVHSKLK